MSRKSSRSSARRITSSPASISSDAEVVEHARPGQLEREVERGLAAERRQERVRPLPLQHAGHLVEVEGLDVGAVGETGSVMIVAGLELTTTVRNPSSRRSLSAWQPE